MRESCTSGSVRGARGNSRPYRNRREIRKKQKDPCQAFLARIEQLIDQILLHFGSSEPKGVR